VAEIRFHTLTRGEVRNLNGQERGSEARRLFKLEELDRAARPVEIVFPDDLDAISTSFFQGMFADSIRSLGSSERFLHHYRFNASPNLMRQIQRGIAAVQTRRHSALSH
jgi:hypothetical protein